jgi:hypothetical protein
MVGSPYQQKKAVDNGTTGVILFIYKSSVYILMPEYTYIQGLKRHKLQQGNGFLRRSNGR